MIEEGEYPPSHDGSNLSSVTLVDIDEADFEYLDEMMNDWRKEYYEFGNSEGYEHLVPILTTNGNLVFVNKNNDPIETIVGAKHE